MKKLLLLLLFATPIQAQDTIRVKHTNYETVFSKSKKYPVLVEWWVTTAKIKCSNPAKRNDKFIPDPKLLAHSNIGADYVGSGFDRGHLAPAADQQCLGAEVMAESFYFTNMAPQHPGLNRGQWKSLEDYTRKLALEHDSIFVQAGCAGEAHKVKSLSVPTHCWKIITIQKQQETHAFVFENVNKKTDSFWLHLVSKDSVRSLRK